MRIPKIYLETTIFNAYFDTDAPDNTRSAKALFEAIERGNYLPYTSDYTINELVRASEEKRGKMIGLIDEFAVQILKTSDDVRLLADEYTAQGIIPFKYATDGLHIAVAAINGIDVIFSFNFKHIVKEKTRVMTKIINEEKGYKGIIISSPREVFKGE